MGMVPSPDVFLHKLPAVPINMGNPGRQNSLAIEILLYNL